MRKAWVLASAVLAGFASAAAAATPQAGAPSVLVLRGGARLAVRSYAVEGRLVRVTDLAGAALSIKADQVDWKRSEEATLAEAERRAHATRQADRLAHEAEDRASRRAAVNAAHLARSTGPGSLSVASEAAPGVPAPASAGGAAATAGEKKDRPTLLFFTAGWCGFCRKMKDGTLAEAGVRRELEGYDLVVIDIDREPELARQYGVRGIPAYITLGAGKGKDVLKRGSGYLPPTEFASWLRP